MEKKYAVYAFFWGGHDLVMLFWWSWWSVCWAFRRALVAPCVFVHVCKAKEGGESDFPLADLCVGRKCNSSVFHACDLSTYRGR